MAETTPTGEAEFRAGFLALCGRPNVGKSTLLNALLRTELALATRFPQTTRERMLGIWSESNFQAVLIDTPGIHRARSAFNKYMVREAERGARDADVVMLLAEVPRLPDIEAAEQWEPGESALAALKTLADVGKPIILVLTKVDRLSERTHLLPIIARWQGLHEFSAVVPVCALRGQGLRKLREVVHASLPPGEPLFDRDNLSDRGMRWHAGERVRAALFRNLSQELPYSCAVTIESYREQRKPPKDTIRATVHVERESQKKVVIGKGGQTIRAISMQARQEIAELTQRPCDLFLTVRLTRNWTKDPDLMKRLGYHQAIGGEA